MSMRNCLQILAAIFVANLLVGCAKPIADTGFLRHGYDDFNVANKRNMKLRIMDANTWGEPVVWTAEGGVVEIVRGEEAFTIKSLPEEHQAQITARPVVFVIAEPQWQVDTPYPEDPEKNKKIVFTVRERLYRYMLRKYAHPTRVRYAVIPGDPMAESHRIVTVTSNLTLLDKGVGFTRYFLGWGIGQASVQIEGELWDGRPEEGSLIGEYAVRASHGGFAQNGLNVNVLKSHYCLLYAADEAIRMFTDEVPNYISGISYELGTEVASTIGELIHIPQTRTMIDPK